MSREANGDSVFLMDIPMQWGQAELKRHWTNVILNEAFCDVYERTRRAQSRNYTPFCFFVMLLALPLPKSQHINTLSPCPFQIPFFPWLHSLWRLPRNPQGLKGRWLKSQLKARVFKKKDPDRQRYQRNRTRTVTWQTFIVFTIKSSPSSLQQTHPTLPNSLDARVQTGITMQIPYVPRRQPTSKLRLDAWKCAPDCRLGVESDWSRTALSFCLTLEDFALSSWTFEHTVTSSAAELESIIWATPFLMIDINANLTDKFPYLWVQKIFVSHHCTVLSKLWFASQVTDKDSVYSL